MSGETDDAFLGGRLRAWQPARGYRAGTDAVLLAAAVPARPSERVLELGCGTGIVLMCLAMRVQGLDLTGIERDAEYAALARRNCERNGLRAAIVEADALNLPSEIKARRYDHVVANPPYLDRRRGKSGRDAGREGAIALGPPLSEWAAAGWRRVLPGGRLTVIASADRLLELLEPLDRRGVTVCPLAARGGRDADRVLVSALKGGRAPFRLTAPFVVHEGPAHVDDRNDDFTPRMRAILRDGAAFCTTNG